MVTKVAAFADWQDPLYVAMGRLVVTYNRAEFEIRALLTDLAANFEKDNRRAHILTAELGSVGLENAIKAIAGDLLPKVEREAIEHALTILVSVRGYRNYYVHGVLSVFGPIADIASAHGQILTYSAKGALSQTLALVTVDQIDETIDHAYALFIYVKSLRQHLQDRVRPTRAFAPAPLPDKPPLPPKLAKPLLRFREQSPPPEAWPK